MNRRANRADPRATVLEDAFAANAPDLLSYFGRRVTVHADGADLLGETFLIATRRHHQMPHAPNEARMWLFGIARRVLANSGRSAKRRSNLTTKLRERLLALPPEQPDTEALDIRAALDALPAAQSELVRLVLWDGFRVPDAARILGISEATARGRYQRARATLAHTLGAYRYERTTS